MRRRAPSASMPLRVLHVIGGLGMGGAETWLLELMRHWQKVGQPVKSDLLLTGGVQEVFDDEARSLGAELHYERYSRANLVSFVHKFRTLIATGQYDAIHDHCDYSAGWRFLMASGLLPKIRISHVHNPWVHIERDYAVTPTRRLAVRLGRTFVKRLATHVCGTSRFVLQQYGFLPTRFGDPIVHPLYCGVDIDRFNRRDGDERATVLSEFGWSPDDKIVLFAGRLDQVIELNHTANHKNSWFALNVLRHANAQNRRFRLIMAGGGSTRPELERRVGEWGLTHELKLVGIRRDIARLMKASDVLLFPSQQEGLGMVAVEAQAAGLPVLASTAVPKEAIVIPELYSALPLGEPISHWSDALISIASRSRPPASHHRATLEASAFNIANSARNTQKIYRQARPIF
jgi:glycosyltransferase EpsF